MNAGLGDEAAGPTPWRDWMQCITPLQRQPDAGGDQSEAQCQVRVRWFVVLGVFRDGLTIPGLTRVRGPYRSARAAARHTPAFPGCIAVATTDAASALALAVGQASGRETPTN